MWPQQKVTATHLILLAMYTLSAPLLSFDTSHSHVATLRMLSVVKDSSNMLERL